MQTHQVSLDLLRVILEALSFANVQVSKEHQTENRIPHGLIDQNLGCDGLRLRPRKLRIKEPIEVMARRPVHEKPEGAKTKRAHRIVGFAVIVDEFLGQYVADRKTCQRSQRLREKRLGLELLVAVGMMCVWEAGVRWCMTCRGRRVDVYDARRLIRS